MIELTTEEARTLVSSYVWLMELGNEHGFPLRPEEYRLYEKVNGALEIETLRGELGFPSQARLRVNLPSPPVDPHREEDPYDPA